MKKVLLLLALCLLSVSSIWAQQALAKVDSSFLKLPLKEKVGGKTWYFNYSMKFHARSEPDSTQKEDMIMLNADMTYTVTDNGKTMQGTWSADEKNSTLNLTNVLTQTTLSLKIASIIQDQMALRSMDKNNIAYYKFYYTKNN